MRIVAIVVLLSVILSSPCYSAENNRFLEIRESTPEFMYLLEQVNFDTVDSFFAINYFQGTVDALALTELFRFGTVSTSQLRYDYLKFMKDHPNLMTSSPRVTIFFWALGEHENKSSPEARKYLSHLFTNVITKGH